MQQPSQEGAPQTAVLTHEAHTALGAEEDLANSVALLRSLTGQASVELLKMKINQGLGRWVKAVKYWLHIHEDLSSDPWHLCKSLWGEGCMSLTPALDGGDKRVRQVHSLASLEKPLSSRFNATL